MTDEHATMLGIDTNLTTINPGQVTRWGMYVSQPCKNCGFQFTFAVGDNSQDAEKRRFHSYHNCPNCNKLYILHIQLACTTIG